MDCTCRARHTMYYGKSTLSSFTASSRGEILTGRSYLGRRQGTPGCSSPEEIADAIGLVDGAI